MKRLNVVVALLLSSFLLCGCLAILVGSGVAAGVAISEDTVRLNKDASFNHAWSVTHRTLKDMGEINLQDKNSGRIEANIRNSTVTAQIKELTAKTVSIEIKARKNLFPNIDLATEISNKLSSRL